MRLLSQLQKPSQCSPSKFISPEYVYGTRRGEIKPKYPSRRILFTSHQVNLKVMFLKQGCQFILPKFVYKTSSGKINPTSSFQILFTRLFLSLSSRAGDQYCQRQDANQWQEAEIVLAGSHHLIVVMLLVRSPSSSARKRTYILPEDFLLVFSLSKSMSYSCFD